MIVSPDGDRLVSSLGWVDKGSLLVWDTRAASAPDRVALSAAQYLSVHDGKDGCFSIAHHFENNERLEISAHRFDAPEQPLSTYRIQNGRISFAGNRDPWPHLKTCYVDYLRLQERVEARLILLGDGGDAEISELAWFDESYDKGYQGLVDVQPVPDSSNLVFGIQRCSQPVIYDPKHRRLVQRLELAGRHGNCDLKFRSDVGELWAVDYDTLVVLNTGTWRLKRSRQLQEAANSGRGETRQFVGGFCFHDQGRLCSVARPFSRDVVTLDASTLESVHETPFPMQPLEVAVVDKTVCVRDWKSGKPDRKPIGS